MIGAVSDEGEGLTGIEAGQDGVLKGVNGERRLVKDALGDPIGPTTSATPRTASRFS